MLAYLSAEGLKQYLHGANAPIWRALVTLDNSTALNAVAAVVTALALGYAVERFVSFVRQDRTPFLGALVAAAFFCVPPFAWHIVGLSPLMASFAPIALSLAALMLPTAGELKPDEEEELQGGEYRMLLSGAFAAVAAWEGTLGVAFVPLILLAIWLPAVCREQPLFRATAYWVLGFSVAAALEGLCLGFEFRALRPVLPPVAGLVVFMFIGVVPALAVLRLKWSRRMVGIWAGVLAVFLTISLTGGFCTSESGCERFAKAVLSDLGERKLIIGDGFTDDFFAVLKPVDVRLLNAYSDEDREFLLNAFESGEPVTNKALVVRHYHGLPEMDEVAEERGLKLRKAEKKPDVRAKTSHGTNAVPVAVALSNEISRISLKARPLMELVEAAEAEFAKPSAQRNRETLEKARETVRRELTTHAFGGARLSNVLVMSDLMLGDTRTAASDAITVLMFDRDDPAANAALGAIRQEEGKFELAERYLRKGVKGGGAFPAGKLAILLIQTDRPEEAVEWAQKAVKLVPGDMSFREPLAAALIESGRLAEAEAELDEIERVAKGNGTQEREEAFLSGARKRLAEKRGK